MISVARKITDEFIRKLKSGSDIRPEQIAKLEELLMQSKAPKVDDLIAVFNFDPPDPKSAVGADK